MPEDLTTLLEERIKELENKTEHLEIHIYTLNVALLILRDRLDENENEKND